VNPFSVEADVSGGPLAAARARGLIRSQLAGRVPRALLRDVALLVTELVANGVRHGGAGSGQELHLRVEGRPPRLRVEVVDPGAGGHGAVAPRSADYAGGGGLGLQIVDRVASRWGVGSGPGTSVWFEVEVPPEEHL
jgi:anti-sigma regulatory factor (Ser/Thr protein kinase)